MILVESPNMNVKESYGNEKQNSLGNEIKELLAYLKKMTTSINKCFYTYNDDDENIKTSCKGAQKKKIIELINDILTHRRHCQK